MLRLTGNGSNNALSPMIVVGRVEIKGNDGEIITTKSATHL